ncbi:hypothetical protein CBR_g49632 [Chara braunii]|uniref:Dienelactone hydrolase domain-containing protein n=1 Tax=Chara braunii TaxID=69332 RepID=A0A388M5E9_CHABU|nr:hypothetical protein CBR_g49632 [Chara braunii]|eukprot:GBG89781.1 hypothetical protein CBR_g49632 [Chara braunii]
MSPAVLLITFVVMAMASSLPVGESAVTVSKVSFPGPGSVTLSAVRYEPDGFSGGSNFPAVVMMHGCSGMWSNNIVDAANSNGTPNLQNQIEKWGLKLAGVGAVALAVDSFTPRGLLTQAEQNQCGGTSSVDPYTTRVQDARLAHSYLTGLAGSKVNGASVALLGWSHGAQSTLVEAAATPRDSTSERLVTEHIFAASVAFYPGCGTALGFGSTVAGSYWRPYRSLQLHVGTADGFYSNCQTRATIAQGSPYNADVAFFGYSDAAHSFDGVSQTWASSKCTAAEIPTKPDECAMRAGDIDGLAFLKTKLGLS